MICKSIFEDGLKEHVSIFVRALQFWVKELPKRWKMCGGNFDSPPNAMIGAALID
jgi:hypothetical protein